MWCITLLNRMQSMNWWSKYLTVNFVLLWSQFFFMIHFMTTASRKVKKQQVKLIADLQNFPLVKYIEQTASMSSPQEIDPVHRKIFPLLSQSDRQNWCPCHLADRSNGKMLISGSDVGFCISHGTRWPDTPNNPQTCETMESKWSLSHNVLET